MNKIWRQTSLAASTLAASLLVAACGGGGDAGPPPAPADTTPPTVAITKDVSAATATGPVTFTFTFSEDVGSSFITDDITVTGGTKGTFTRTSGTLATLVVTPAADTTGTIDVSVAAAKFADLASNNNTAAASLQQAFNTVVVIPGSTATCTAAPCIAFDAANVQFEAFEGLLSAAVANDPLNAANKVAKLVKQASGQPWAGATIYTSDAAAKTVTPIDLSSTKVITLRVYSPAVGEKIMLKVENAANGGQNMEAQALTTKANAWETLSFNFAAPSAGAFDPTAVYNRISLFPGFMTQVDKTYYFDELKYVASTAVAPVSLKFASNYAASGNAWKSVENGDAGTYIDDSVPTQFWWNGVASADSTPSFYFGYGVNTATKPWGFGAFVKAPANGSASMTGLSKITFALWGNDQMIVRQPTFTVILKGPTAAGCTTELKSTVTASGALGVASYTLALNAFTIQTACTYANAAAILAAGVKEVHFQVLGSNLQYTAGGDGSGNFPNGLNVGPITFSN